MGIGHRPTPQPLDGARADPGNPGYRVQVGKSSNAAAAYDGRGPRRPDPGQALQRPGVGDIEVQRQPEEQAGRAVDGRIQGRSAGATHLESPGPGVHKAGGKGAGPTGPEQGLGAGAEGDNQSP